MGCKHIKVVYSHVLTSSQRPHKLKIRKYNTMKTSQLNT